jgi:hypothetical protein
MGIQRRSKASPAPVTVTQTGRRTLQRQCACGNHTVVGGECESCCNQREGRLQRAAVQPSAFSPYPSAVPPIVHEVLRSPGQPLNAARALLQATPE